MGYKPGLSSSRTALAVVLALGLSGLALVAPVAQAKGLESLADLAEQVSDAVVNISATTLAEKKEVSAEQPNVPPGTPFDDLFNEFFKRRQQGQQGQGAPVPDLPMNRKSSSLGSGFVIDGTAGNAIVITNNHVIADANDITVIFTDGTKLKAELIGKDSKVDVAVLKIKPDKALKAVKFGDSEKMRVGDPVMAVGNPFGLGGTVTAGIVSARNRNIDSGPYDNYIQTDASINKGNSGGPLFNMAGEVIGINTAILSPSGGSIGLGFATPAATVMPIIEQLKSFGETRRGWLGVRIQSVDDAIAESLGLGTARGALVAGITPGGPAEPSGMKTGDVILKFDGKDVKDSRDLPKIVAATAVGKAVDVIVMRGGKEVTLQVTLGRLEDGEKLVALDNGGKSPDAGKPAVQKALGMEFSALSDEVRKKFKIKDSVKGVVVSTVDAGSVAADKRVQPGEVIVEINQDAMATPADITKKIKALKDGGKKSALMLVATPQGEVRFVALAID